MLNGDGLDFGDAWDQTGGDANGNPYPTLLEHDGARHVIVPGFFMGHRIDAESDGQPTQDANGDDYTDLADEDGVTLHAPLVPGQTASFTVYVTDVNQLGGTLNAWIDLDGSGDWTSRADEHFVQDVAVTHGANRFDIPLPADATVGSSVARFRLSTAAGLTPQGEAPDGEVEDYAVDIIETKWVQPPEPATPDNIYLGWNEPSYVNQSSQGSLAGDDWVCDTTDPVTEIVWWGSFLDWNDGSQLPQVAPSSFHFAIWTDVPVGPDDPFSHPGTVEWVHDSSNCDWEWVGWDYDPRTGTYEAAYRFSVSLDEVNQFDQPGDHGIYWLTISAGYDTETIDHPFGWKTRPRDPASPAPDDAVRISNPVVAGMGAAWGAGGPLEYPAGRSWDLAFELRTPSENKHEQLPDPSLPGLHAHDIVGFATVLADNWICPGGNVTELHWYGNYENNHRGSGIMQFQLSIHPNAAGVPWDLPQDPGDIYVAIGGSFTETDTGLVTVDGSIIYKYEYVLPEPFVQELGQKYWFDITALANNPENPPLWRWQEAQRGAPPIIDPAAEYGESGWQSIQWANPQPPPDYFYSDMAFAIVSSEQGLTKAKWSQPPELYVPQDAHYGWDEESVYAFAQIVADDWVCTDDQPVTDIHWWGSFLGWTDPDLGLPQFPSAFHIGIWTDVPPGADPYSHPGQMIWENYADTFEVQFAGWDFDPRSPDAPPEATFYFEQLLDPDEWFWQEGQDTIYWVSIAAVYGVPPGNVEYPFGWKTRPRDVDSPAPDDAVRIFAPTGPDLVGNDTYQDGGPIFWPEPADSWDMAFVLTTTPLDFGDAPDPLIATAGEYPTLLVNDGARHLLGSGLHMGAAVDIDPDGQPNATATGDDNAGATPDDEDGVVLNGLLVPGQYASFTITASAPGLVDAWLDFDSNGTWDHPQEQILGSEPVIAGANNFAVLVPSDAVFGNTFARFRISTAGGLSPTGLANDGEVEDYGLTIETVNRFVVDATGDAGDASPGDGNCDDGAGNCTLRAALDETNALSNLAAGPDVIIFDIAGVGPHTIQPGSALPSVTEAVVTDGTAEPDFAGTPVVEVDGTNAGVTSGLVLGAGAAGSTIRGLAINRFGYEGIDIIGGGNNTIEGNYLGTDVAGAVDQGNGFYGIWVSDSTSNQIGGTAVGVGNVISGNRYGMVIAGAGSTGNMVEGNRIGTNAAGNAAVPNDFHGVLIQNGATGNTIGGTASGSGNQISGNTRNGVKITGAATTGNMVQGNLIGTDATGNAPLANIRHGIEITGGASSNSVGGTVDGAGNVISGNTRYGMLIGTAGTTGNVVEGNLIGTDAAGAVPLGNTLHGIVVNGGATGNTIGGTAAGAGNVISGNDRFGVVISNPPTTGNVFAGNLIGTNPTGSAALRNDFHGVLITGGAHSNTIGGTAAGAGNVISGNSLSGVKVVGAGTSGNLVQGNRIGTDGAGNVSLANGRDGVEISSSATGNTIGGTAAGASNVISGNTRYGVIINTATATGNVIEGNRIGTDAAGTSALGNGEHGVVMALGAHANTIGGTAAGAGNVISGNSNHGVFLSGDNNILQGNLIGTDAAGTGPLGNAGSGIFVAAADGTQIGGTASGAGNTIAHNGVRGVTVFSGNTGNRISRNSIHDNGGAARLGIDLNNDNATANDAGDPDTGANNLQNFPEIQTAILNGGNVDITYSVPSTAANSAFPLTVEFFLADADGQEGETYLGSDSYSEGTTPTATVPNGGAVAGAKIVATATDDDGNTSEFSASVTAGSPLLAAGGEASQESSVEGQKLEAGELMPVVDAAIDRLVGAGFAGESFYNVHVSVADLPGATLGLATGTSIVIDVNAAGYGWFIDSTPQDDSEFTVGESLRDSHSASRSAAATRMDLLTVVMHELGHTAGLTDLYDIESEDDLMYAWLQPGERRADTAAVDSVFTSLLD